MAEEQFKGNNNPFNQKKDVDEQDKQSSYKNFQRESDRIITMKERFEDILFTLNPSDSIQRRNILFGANIMKQELTLSNDFEKNKFNDIINTLTQLDLTIEKSDARLRTNGTYRDFTAISMMNEYYRAFEKYALAFNEHYINTQARTNLQFSTPKGLGELEKLMKISEVSNRPYFPNEQNLLISPQLELLCRVLFLRAVNDYDNVIVIDAKRGRGKSALALTIASTLSSMFKTAFDLDRHVVFGETRAYCMKLLSDVPRFTTIVFDQAGNQLNAKTAMDREQVDLTNAQDLNRFHGLTTIFCWHDISMVDKDIRERIATHYITIETRGLANLKSFNLNPHNRGLTSTKKEKGALILTPESAQQQTASEATTIFTIPYLPLEDNNTEQAKEIWKRYSMRKLEAQAIMTKISQRKLAKKREEMM